MSFSSEVKKELCSIEMHDFSQMKSQCYGMLIQGICNEDEISLTTEKRSCAMCFAQLLAQTANVFCDVRNTNRMNRTISQYVVSVPNIEQRKQVLKTFMIHSQVEYLDRTNISDEYAAFIRGLFLTGGTVSDPQKDYHFEITLQNPALINDIISVFRSVSLSPKIIMRSSQHVLYFKDSGMIEDALTFMGAINASMSVMDAKIVKDVRNRANRLTNCETANIEKTVTAAMQQIDAIKRVDKSIGIDALPEDLRETARLRLDNPDMSLSELAKSLSEPISRSGVNHRLKRICELAKAVVDK